MLIVLGLVNLVALAFIRENIEEKTVSPLAVLSFVVSPFHSHSDPSPAVQPNLPATMGDSGDSDGSLDGQSSSHGLHPHHHRTFSSSSSSPSSSCLSSSSLATTLSLPTLLAQATGKELGRSQARPLLEVVTKWSFLFPCALATLAQSVMFVVMSNVGLEMKANDFSSAQVSLVFDLHFFSMFAPGFFTGTLISSFGTLPVAFSGSYCIYRDLSPSSHLLF